jgi:hypothetical protein
MVSKVLIEKTCTKVYSYNAASIVGRGLAPAAISAFAGDECTRLQLLTDNNRFYFNDIVHNDDEMFSK